ncbi:MAG TPA: VRR-NUC domain-containing protein [Cellvibrio sp.]|nr:VRR-NUC domain-containing protein [Cellvibrio sp.]
MTESPPFTPNLPPDYYLNNFRFLVDWVKDRYADLLSDDEQKFVQGFYLLGHDAQCLLVRLSSRKGPLFRRDKLDYSEIKNLDDAAQELISAGLLHRHFPLPLDVFVSSLTKVELLLLFREQLTGLRQARKEILVEHLQHQFTEARDWQSWTENQLGEAFYLDNQRIINNLLLLFFGNSYQNLTEFVLQDLGLYRYENYPIDHQHRLFNSRDEIDQYWSLIQLREQLDVVTSIDALIELATKLPAAYASKKIQRRRAKLINQIAYALERVGEYQIAMQLYEQSHLTPARERRIRLLEKQENFSAAWTLLNELIANPQNEHELQISQRIAPRIAKKLSLDFHKKKFSPVNEQHQMFTPLVNELNEPLRVEEVVRLFLNNENAPCVYTENTLLTGLFGLWLWPETFRGVEGAFANPFQAAPLDMHQENFTANRPGIAALWQLIDNETYPTHIKKIWTEKFGTTNYLVNWSFLSEELLELALHCIPAQHLKVIFERLLFDIKNNCSGLPDLIQFYPAQKSYRMIEVKGPGDRIQDNQARWLDYFMQHGIPAEVWYVRWK